ncbi:hypothetical protein N5P37_001707 [Trichoderma harzianum]|nr:hypothetical protein N5P37_001707 [Trichoderma harzianum]
MLQPHDGCYNIEGIMQLQLQLPLYLVSICMPTAALPRKVRHVTLHLHRHSASANNPMQPRLFPRAPLPLV